MKVLFTSFPAFGYLLPILPLAAAAHAAGDDVLVSTNATFASVVGSPPFLSSGLSLPELMAENDRRTGVDLTPTWSIPSTLALSSSPGLESSSASCPTGPRSNASTGWVQGRLAGEAVRLEG